ncbi:MAG: thioredoxin family protein [Candidatus Puniceispirillaceae bacterium]
MFARRFSLLAFTIAVLLASMPQLAFAATRLIMVTSDHCPFCRAWERDVGKVYDKSPYAPDLPLTRVQMGATMPDGIVLDTPVVGTPTFVILRDGAEIDRQLGYENAEMFWWWLSAYKGD